MWRPRRTGQAGLVHRAGTGSARCAVPAERQDQADSTGQRLGSARGDRRPDGAPWVTDGGLNAIVRVDPESFEVTHIHCRKGSGYTNLNTAAFDARASSGSPASPASTAGWTPPLAHCAYSTRRAAAPYGIASTPAGDIYYASLAGSHIARIDTATGEAQTIEPPTPGQGARRVVGLGRRIWVSEWLSGQLALRPENA